MSSNVYSVSNYVENIYGINSARLVNALVLKYANPLVSIPFVKRNKKNENVEELCKQAKMDYKDEQFFDHTGNLVTRDVMFDAISTDLCSSAKLFLESDEDKVYHANMVKFILKNNLLPMLQVKDENMVLTVDDLMAKLYNVNEEKGSRSK